MLFLVAFWWAVLGVTAQLADTPPKCALSCVVPTNYQGCATADTRCLCTNPTAATGVQACIQKQCTTDSDRSAAVAFAQQECESLTASPSDSESAISTKTASSASEGTDASFGNGASFGLRVSFFPPSMSTAVLVIIPPALGAIIGIVA